MKILLMDDDRDLVDLLGYALRRAGLHPLQAFDAPTALELLDEGQPDLAVLGVNLGPGDGLQLLRDLRRQSRILVLILSERLAEDDKVLAFELGANDYLTKPCSHRELIARIRAHLRRQAKGSTSPKPTNEPPETGLCTPDSAKHAATIGGERPPYNSNQVPPAALSHN